MPPKRRQPQQSRSWIGTLNNYTEGDLQAIRQFECLYKAIGFHVGSKSHIPHIHVLVQFKNPRGWPKKGLTNRYHWEPRRGSVTQAINYLNKESRLEEYGERPADPKSYEEGFDELVDQIKEGHVDKYSLAYANHEGYANRRLAETKPRRNYDGDLKDKNIWIWGPPRTGKSRLVRTTFDSSEIYVKNLNKWWDAYDDTQHRVVLIEDADPIHCKFLAHLFKNWADRYSFNPEIKNGSTVVNPDYHLVVTSNYPIEECFEGVDAEAIAARFEVLKFN